MKARYAESSVRISTTITDQERISRWGRTRPSRDRFSRRKWGQSWRCPRSVDCTTAMNGGPPERAGVYTSVSPFEIYIRNCAHLLTRVPTKFVYQTGACPRAAEIHGSPGDAIWHGLHRIFVRDKEFTFRARLLMCSAVAAELQSHARKKQEMCA